MFGDWNSIRNREILNIDFSNIELLILIMKLLSGMIVRFLYNDVTILKCARLVIGLDVGFVSNRSDMWLDLGIVLVAICFPIESVFIYWSFSRNSLTNIVNMDFFVSISGRIINSLFASILLLHLILVYLLIINVLISIYSTDRSNIAFHSIVINIINNMNYQKNSI